MGLPQLGQRDVGWSMLILASRLVRFFADGKDPLAGGVRQGALCARRVGVRARPLAIVIRGGLSNGY